MHAYQVDFKLKAVDYAGQHGNRAAAKQFNIHEINGTEVKETRRQPTSSKENKGEFPMEEASGNGSEQTNNSKIIREMVNEVFENSKFLLIVLSGLHQHLAPEDAEEAVKTVKDLILECIKLSEEMGISMKVISQVQLPKFPMNTITFIEEKFPEDIWPRFKEFGSAWTTARNEDQSLQEYFAPTFGGTLALNLENYRPHIFGCWQKGSTISSRKSKM